jgi:hypothetical protein
MVRSTEIMKSWCNQKTYLSVNYQLLGWLNPVNYFQSLMAYGSMIGSQPDLTKSFESSKRSHQWDDGTMVGCQLIRQSVQVVQENRPTIDGGKRVMTCHHMLAFTCHATSKSTCHSTLGKLTPHYDVSFHVNIHMSCYISSFHVNQQRWLTIDGQVK